MFTMGKNRRSRGVNHPSNTGYPRWRGVLFVLAMAIAVLGCGGTASTVIPDGSLDPVKQSISGLPQFVAPSSTPIPTNTQAATDIAAAVYIPPGGYITNTADPALIYVCNATGSICGYATRTPNGGFYSTPGGYVPGATSTARPTYTPYPSASPCVSSFTYYYDEEVFTDPSSDNLTLGIALGNVRVFASQLRPDEQIVAWTVEIRNIGQIDYILFAPFQIYVAEIDGKLVGNFSSEEAARELGIEPHEATLDAYVLEPNRDLRFDMFAYTSIGAATALAYILDPYGNGYDGTIAGGNVAYWESGDRGQCGGRIGENYTPQANLTPQPSATASHTPVFQGN